VSTIDHNVSSEENSRFAKVKIQLVEIAENCDNIEGSF
jgi:hypothetical protein